MQLVVLPSEESFELTDRPLVVGSDPTCDGRVAGAAQQHVRIDKGTIEALAKCVIGHVALEPSMRRLVVPGCPLELGEARLAVLENEAPPPSNVPTRELVKEIMAKAAEDPSALL